VHEQEPAQKVEAADGVVGRVGRLHALGARNAHANVRGADHVDVVGAVADGQAARGGHARAHELDHFLLLVRPAPAADDGAARLGEHEQVRLRARRARL